MGPIREYARPMLRMRGIPLITICVLAGLAAGPAPAGAAIFVVTDTGDPAPGACVSGVDCSLREAVNRVEDTK